MNHVVFFISYLLCSSFSSNTDMMLTLPVPRLSESFIKIKIKLNFHFHTSLWCLKRFYEGLSEMRGAERVKITL